jgi:hypothetical protein
LGFLSRKTWHYNPFLGKGFKNNKKLFGFIKEIELYLYNIWNFVCWMFISCILYVNPLSLMALTFKAERGKSFCLFGE